MIQTARLFLRPWESGDVAEFLRVTNTPAVMKYLGGVRDPDDTRAGVERMCACQAENGFCFWIVERKSDAALLGFCGLKIGNVATIVGEIEIGWRLREDAWGQGYAREAAEASLDWAWHNLSCPRIVAITATGNSRSWGLMERLGMNHAPELDFEHPEFLPGDPVRNHVVYVIDRPSTTLS